MMKKIKEYMAHPYTRGDYWGAIGIAMALYAVITAAYVLYQAYKSKKILKNDNGVYSIEDEEA